jgi:tRNA threonylcarbamoyladenosine biosynthesis protein TsaE
MTISSNSERETENVGATLGKTLKPGDIVALFGGLGAGKTAFTRGIARGLGITSRVTSPTFTVVNEYVGTGTDALPLFHFDMYRLASGEELFELGWDDYQSRGGVCVVEWSENIADYLPPDAIRVTLRVTGEFSREIEIENSDNLDNN